MQHANDAAAVTVMLWGFLLFCAVTVWGKYKQVHAIYVQSGPKKRYPGFNFAITSVNVHQL